MSIRRSCSPLAVAAFVLAFGASGPAQDQRSALEPLHEPGPIGLVELPGIYVSNAAPLLDVPVRADATMDAATIARLDGTGARTPAGNRLCLWRRDLDRRDGDTAVCEFVEAGYEIPALRVLETAAPGWYRVELGGLPGQSGWIRTENRFHTLVDLLAGGAHLTYLDRRRWDRRLSAEPGAPGREVLESTLSQGPQVAYEAVDSAVRDGRLWLHVRLLDAVCLGREPVEIARGWVPAKTASGQLNAWFWSRGC